MNRNWILRKVLVSLIPFLVIKILHAEQPNVILMMADDLGWGDLKSFWPESKIQTPHLDDMARSGIRFHRFYAAAPVCSPTRGSCLTGRHPYRYGIFFANSGHLKDEEITLSEVLQQHGYETGHFGKWHLGTLTKTRKDANRGGPRGAQHFSPPQKNGFDVCFSTESKVPTFDPMLKPEQQSSSQTWPFISHRSSAFPYGTRYWNERGTFVQEGLEGDDSKVIVDRALPFIASAVEKNKPFFAVVWFHSPHLPVVAGPEKSKKYSGYTLYEKSYFGCVTAMDDQVGRLRQRLRELGVANNTMLWFCSDNGPEGQNRQAPGSAGPLRGRKRSLYEGGIRVCGMLEWPARIMAGRTTEFPAVTSDYLPTILDAIQVPLPEKRIMDGVSLMPLIRGADPQRDSPICFQSKRQCAIMSPRFKLYSSNSGRNWELYDLINDRREAFNIAAQHPQIVANLKTQFFDWQKSCALSLAGKEY